MQLQDIPIDLIDDAPINPNVMPELKYKALVAAIRRFGFKQNVIVEAREDGRYTMRDGHHRKRAAKEVGMSSLPSAVLEPGDDAKAIMLTMNNIHGDLDLGLVADVVADLHMEGWSVEELEVSGFSAVELKDLLNAKAEDPDKQVLDGGVPQEPAMDPEDEKKGTKPFRIELEFSDQPTYKRVRKALRRAAGKGQPLAEGLVKILDAGDEG